MRLNGFVEMLSKNSGIGNSTIQSNLYLILKNSICCLYILRYFFLLVNFKHRLPTMDNICVESERKYPKRYSSKNSSPI